MRSKNERYCKKHAEIQSVPEQVRLQIWQVAERNEQQCFERRMVVRQRGLSGFYIVRELLLHLILKVPVVKAVCHSLRDDFPRAIEDREVRVAVSDLLTEVPKQRSVNHDQSAQQDHDQTF